MSTIYMSDNFQFGAPLGWKPRSGVTWNGYYLPYHIRITDMEQCYERESEEVDLAASRIDADMIIERDIYTGATREWDSFTQASEHYNFADLVRRQETGSLVADRLYFYRASDPPTEDKIRWCQECVAIKHAFGR